MDALDFGIEVVAISASGVLSPGPLFFTNMLYGTKHGIRAGLKMAYGHTSVELPLVVLLAAGLFSASTAINQYASLIGILGGASILGFAAMQVIGAIKKKQDKPVDGKRGPFIAGVALTALNPFFLVWWFTVGLKLISDSTAFGLGGITLLFGFHIWMDYAWLAATAYIASKGSSVIKSKYYPLLLLGLAAVLVYYGVYFIMKSVGAL